MPQLQSRSDEARLSLFSPVFHDGERIPVRFTADGENVSPPLAWGEPPPETRSLALVCEDPDAPSGLFVHWILWDIPPGARSLEEAVTRGGEAHGVHQGKNGFGATGYGGPKPPPGKPHRYVFRLVALESELDLPQGAGWREFAHAVEGKVIGTALLTGLYGR